MVFIVKKNKGRTNYREHPIQSNKKATGKPIQYYIANNSTADKRNK
jgi:hypothetical protein